MPRAHRPSIAMLAATVAIVVASAPPASASTTVALWHMNERSGRMVDSSRFDNDGSLRNITRVSPGFNGSGRAYRFNGRDSRVIIPNAPSLNPDSQTIAITAHVRFGVEPPPSVVDYDLVRKGSGIYKMEILDTGRGFCRFEGTNGVLSITAGPNLADSEWHTIVCRKTSSAITLTVDGRSWSQEGNVGAISSGAVLVLGGKPNASGDWYRGAMDEVRIVIG